MLWATLCTYEVKRDFLTSKMYTLIQRCPYFRGVLISGIEKAYLGHSIATLKQRCPYFRGVQVPLLLWATLCTYEVKRDFLTSKMYTLIQRCPYFRGVLISGIEKAYLGHSIATLKQRCHYFRGVQVPLLLWATLCTYEVKRDSLTSKMYTLPVFAVCIDVHLCQCLSTWQCLLAIKETSAAFLALMLFRLPDFAIQQANPVCGKIIQQLSIKAFDTNSSLFVFTLVHIRQ